METIFWLIEHKKKELKIIIIIIRQWRGPASWQWVYCLTGQGLWGLLYVRGEKAGSQLVFVLWSVHFSHELAIYSLFIHSFISSSRICSVPALCQVLGWGLALDFWNDKGVELLWGLSSVQKQLQRTGTLQPGTYFSLTITLGDQWYCHFHLLDEKAEVKFACSGIRGIDKTPLAVFLGPRYVFGLGPLSSPHLPQSKMIFNHTPYTWVFNRDSCQLGTFSTKSIFKYLWRTHSFSQ